MKNSIMTFLIVIVGILAAVGQGKSKIPGVFIRNLDGEMVNATEVFQTGKPVIINFWASWCHPCIKELSAIEEMYDDWQNETGVILYAISVDDSRSQNNARVMIKSNSWSFEFYFDTNGDFKRAMGVVNIPHTFVLDEKGEIISQHTSYSEGNELEIIRKIKEMKDK